MTGWNVEKIDTEQGYRSKTELKQQIVELSNELGRERERRLAAERELEAVVETIDTMARQAKRETDLSDCSPSAAARVTTLDALREHVGGGTTTAIERGDGK